MFFPIANPTMRFLRYASIALIVACAMPAAAEPPTRAQLDQTYEQVLRNPSDRKLTLQYAAIAMQLKDYEAAIPPLERILISEPDNAKIKLQVGTLYKSLGSKLMAKQYFTDAMNTRNVSPAIAREAQENLRGL